MSIFHRFIHAAAFASAILTVAGTVPARACSVCGCSLSSDWAALGYEAGPGCDAGLRFEYFDQTELRTGSHRARAAEALPNDNEIQQRTLNRNIWLDLNYVLQPNLAVTVSVPYHDRFHTTIAAGDDDVSTSQASGLGDVRVVGRYQMAGAASSFSLQFGGKFPTGRFDQNFASGPQAGALLDRGLQLGTGTTDLLAGASWFARPATQLGCFVQAMLDQPLAERDGFVPSTSLSFNGGIRWLNTSRVVPQLQFNFKTETREHGQAADTASSGGTFIHLSPGLAVELTDQSKAYVFVQVPVYQRVNGLQLVPRWILSAGLHWKI